MCEPHFGFLSSLLTELNMNERDWRLRGLKNGLKIFFPVAQLSKWFQCGENFFPSDIGHCIGNTPATQVFCQLGNLLSLLFWSSFDGRVIQLPTVGASINSVKCMERAEHQNVSIPWGHVGDLWVVLH